MLLFGQPGGHHLNKPVISPEELLEIYNRESVLVAIGCDYDKEISKQLDDMGITDYVLLKEMLGWFRYLSVRKRINKSTIYSLSYERNSKNNILYTSLVDNPDDTYIFICQPAKSGGSTVSGMCDSSGLDRIWCNHNPKTYKDFCDVLGDKLSDCQIRIIMAVRDPISQNLSEIYQALDMNMFFMVPFWDDAGYLGNGADAQKIFTKIMEQYLNSILPIYEINNEMFFMIQNFYAMLKNTDIGISFLDKKFDKKAGFSIYQEGNVEVFVYQLEKLNVIWNEICNWLGIEQLPLVNKNVGDNKWYDMSYRQAQKEIKITQEYFDKCYNEPYVKHFYSDEDIEKFKARWKGHIVSDI